MRELAVFLARRKGDYKGGIPFREAAKAKMIFVLEKGTDKDRDFLENLTAKGFGQKLSDQICLNAGELKKSELPGEARFVLAFCELADEPSRRLERLGAPVFKLPSIETIQREPALKKKLWAQIKDL